MIGERSSIVYRTRGPLHPLRRHRTPIALRGSDDVVARRSEKKEDQKERGETERGERGRGSMISMTPPTLWRMKTNNLEFCLKLW